MSFQSCATKCKTCASLLADYKYSFKLFTDAVRHLPGLVGHDRALTHQKLEQLRLACRDASDALLAHLRQEHTDLVGIAGSSQPKQDNTGIHGPAQLRDSTGMK